MPVGLVWYVVYNVVRGDNTQAPVSAKFDAIRLECATAEVMASKIYPTDTALTTLYSLMNVQYEHVFSRMIVYENYGLKL
ncbi:hypothetical protein BDN72DRAFT_843359 [Pluteus cervinus]|uniref:Uncharacterized protein n=1 Tax=Pluteus cervinus TaxID=181527 RepID=A0ACD3API8_9AGAR|nr:hypothetical protein BDN72DRAFT_843359 [Pluteus cervinus]